MFETEVENAIQEMLHSNAPGADFEGRVKLLNVAVRWAAVKNKLTLPDHGSGFDDDE